MTEQKDIEPKESWDWMVKNFPEEISETAKAIMFLAHHITDDEGHLSILGYQSERIADALENISASLEKIEKRGRPDPGYGIF